MTHDPLKALLQQDVQKDLGLDGQVFVLSVMQDIDRIKCRQSLTNFGLIMAGIITIGFIIAPYFAPPYFTTDVFNLFASILTLTMSGLYGLDQLNKRFNIIE